MLLLIQTLDALGGLLVLIAGIVGAKPFCGLKLNPGNDLSTVQITCANLLTDELLTIPY
jgi:hypothetical protein